jgi:hypothetical protein
VSATASRTGRDIGTSLVLSNAGEWWQYRACTQALRLLKRRGARGALFEEIRDFALATGVPEPHHANAWGALALAMARRGFIKRTGQYACSRSVRSHARRQPYWMIDPAYRGPLL